MKTPHKHAELIKAWADGAEIECRLDGNDKWDTVINPQWINEFQYRIKPAPKPDVVLYGHVDSFSDIDSYSYDICGSFNTTKLYTDNLKLTFHAETNKLIKAEVI